MNDIAAVARPSVPIGAVQTQKWPARLWIVRHGQSAGNVAREAAERARATWIDLATRDVDTPLSSLGERQSRALGSWFGGLPEDERPTVVLSSPYVRSMRSAELIVESARGFTGEMTIVADERLREKEFGILDRMTTFGIKQTYPSLNEQRQHVGKFYFRPPGGESWRNSPRGPGDHERDVAKSCGVKRATYHCHIQRQWRKRPPAGTS